MKTKNPDPVLCEGEQGAHVRELIKYLVGEKLLAKKRLRTQPDLFDGYVADAVRRLKQQKLGDTRPTGDLGRIMLMALPRDLRIKIRKNFRQHLRKITESPAAEGTATTAPAPTVARLNRQATDPIGRLDELGGRAATDGAITSAPEERPRPADWRPECD